MAVCDADEVKVLASRLGNGSVRYGKEEWLRGWGFVGWFNKSGKSMRLNVSHCCSGEAEINSNYTSQSFGGNERRLRWCRRRRHWLRCWCCRRSRN